jgi:hypothetical protein
MNTRAMRGLGGAMIIPNVPEEGIGATIKNTGFAGAVFLDAVNKDKISRAVGEQV